ncbi:SDR family NAD(P)-dependent oxidoreductase (plasmid) [Haladaptatus sp. SPP-AMP-3]
MEASTQSNWTTRNMPDQSGRTVIVTGANSGHGFEATKAFAREGANVVMACRSLDRATRARREIESMVTDASLTVLELDLGSQAFIRQFVTDFESKFDRLDVLLNNAGIMMTPYSTTEDGFERQLGVNHLGHFALTGLLLDYIVETDGETRVVTQSSITHKSGSGEIHFDDLNGKHTIEAGALSNLALPRRVFIEISDFWLARKTVVLRTLPSAHAPNIRA